MKFSSQNKVECSILYRQSKIHCNNRGSTCISYVKGVSEKVKSILTQAGVRTAFKPDNHLRKYFQKSLNKDHRKHKQKLLYTNSNASCAHLHTSGVRMMLVFSMA